MKAGKPPNILLILTDQHRADALGCAGNPHARTPNIDALANESFVFDSAYTPSPICGPARAALFTGKSALQTGIHRNWIPLSNEYPLLSSRLQQSGYRTGLVGKLHISPVEDAHGFAWRRICDSPHDVYDADEIVYNDYLRWAARKMDTTALELAVRAGESERISSDDPRFWLGWEWAPHEAQIPRWTAEQAVEFLARTGPEPFFLNVSFFGPHHPYALCEPWDSLIDFNSAPLSPLLGKEPGGLRQGKHFPDWPEETWREIMAKYLGQVAAIDHYLGSIFRTLRDQGMWDDTLIVFASDHGDLLGDYSMIGKGNMLEGSVRIPLVVKPPGPRCARQNCSEVVSLMDLYSTLLEYAGEPSIENPERSLCKVMEGSGEVPDEAFASFSNPEMDTGQLMLVQGGWKLVRNLSEQEFVDELYNRSAADPDSFNYANDSTHSSILHSMQARLEQLVTSMTS